MIDNIGIERMRLLAEKWQNGSISEAEKAEFVSWYHSFPESDVPIPPEIAISESALGRQILSNLENEVRNEKRTIILPFTRIAAAIVVGLSLFALIGYFYFERDTQPAVAINKTVIRPGSDGAILTLADGRQIRLDSSANGIIAEQNASKISLEGKSLSYEKKSLGKETAVLYNSISTPRGRQFQLVLSDGTKVWLNAASNIIYPVAFNAESREVKISGEAYFEVAKDRKRPFTVDISGKGKVEVLGTSFNIKAYRDEMIIETTLLEGAVKVLSKNRTNRLLPGQQAIINETSLNIIDNVDIIQVMGWQKGNFEFNNVTVESLMKQISRWYDVEVKYEGPIPQKKLGGAISKYLPLESILKLLDKNGIHSRIEGKTITIYG